MAAAADGAAAPPAPAPKFWDVPLERGGALPADRSRFVRLHPAPRGGAGAVGTLVVIHGGYWKNKFGLDDEYGNAGTISLAPWFLERGFSAVELEYRRRDHEGGGWPGTNEDILAALRLLAQLQTEASGASFDASSVASAPALGDEGREALRQLRPDRLVLVGHSAGGCLALWAAHKLHPAPATAAAGAGALAVAAVVACAPVADLERGHSMRISDEGDAVELYMKCRPEDGEEAKGKYTEASPSAMLPVTFPALIVYGDKDVDVPPQLVADYAKAAVSGAPDLVREVPAPGADHFDVVNAASAAWKESIAPALAAALEPRLGAEASLALKS